MTDLTAQADHIAKRAEAQTQATVESCTARSLSLLAVLSPLQNQTPEPGSDHAVCNDTRQARSRTIRLHYSSRRIWPRVLIVF